MEDAVRGCSGVFSALAAGPGRGASEDVEYRGNMNLLSVARSAGVGHFPYSSVHLADHPLAQKVGAFREMTASRRSYWMRRTSLPPSCTRLYSWMETLDMMIQGPVALVPGRQRRPASLIAARDIARAAVRAIQRDILGCYELAGPETLTFDGAFYRLGMACEKKIRTLHVPLATLHTAGRFSPYVREMAHKMALSDEVGFTTNPSALRNTFDVPALTIGEWPMRNGKRSSIGVWMSGG